MLTMLLTVKILDKKAIYFKGGTVMLSFVCMIVWSNMADSILVSALSVTRDEPLNNLVRGETNVRIVSKNSLPKFRIIEADSLPAPADGELPLSPIPQRRLDFQLQIHDGEPDQVEPRARLNQTGRNQYRPPKRRNIITLSKAQVHQEQSSANEDKREENANQLKETLAKKYAAYGKHFYTLEPQDLKTTDDELEIRRNLIIVKRPKISTTPMPNMSKRTSTAPRSELIRTQHRPPWLWTATGGGSSNFPIDQLKRFKLRLTTMAPITTTEFFKLISSAHSPIKLSDLQKRFNLFTRNRTKDGPAQEGTSLSDGSLAEISERKEAELAEANNSTLADISANSTDLKSSLRPTLNQLPPSEIANLHYYNREKNKTHQKQLAAESGQIMSPEILVKDEDTSSPEQHSDHTLSNQDADQPIKASQLSMNKLNASHIRKNHLINYTITHSGSSKRKPVTIVRYLPARATTKAPTLIVIPDKLTIDEYPNEIAVDSLGLATTIAPQLVRMIAKQKHKYDENITSPPLTVIDNDVYRLPPNTTAIHNNRLLVRSKPGHPSPPRSLHTTEYPYYNPVAGITPPYPSSQPTRASRPTPPAQLGSHYGLVRPGPDQLVTTQAPSTFGAPNVKFPANPPSELLPDSMDSPTLIPERVNISVPSTANVVGPNKVPDKIFLDTGEELSRPVDALVISDSTNVAQPFGTNTTNHNGIIRVSTTRRPNRFSTTRRINIVSANTTVITTNPDQLHDVMSNAIMGSHQQEHVNQSNRPENRPSFLASIAKLFNAGVTTSVLALLTLIKTILIAVLVMFLPPIALTAAIMQAVSIG